MLQPHSPSGLFAVELDKSEPDLLAYVYQDYAEQAILPNIFPEINRDTHNLTHVRAYKCPNCDFSTRGFATKSSLRKHQETYHIQPEDFQVRQVLERKSALNTAIPHGQSQQYYVEQMQPLAKQKSLGDSAQRELISNGLPEHHQEISMLDAERHTKEDYQMAQKLLERQN